MCNLEQESCKAGIIILEKAAPLNLMHKARVPVWCIVEVWRPMACKLQVLGPELNPLCMLPGTGTVIFPAGYSILVQAG